MQTRGEVSNAVDEVGIDDGGTRTWSPMIEVRNVVKRYAAHVAVDDVSFQARPGEIFGLLGPNGAGKTTIIRMIMNILTPDSGEVLFDGRPVAERDKNRIGYLPEERGLYRRQTVTEVLTYLAELKGVPSSQSAVKIRSWLARFDLADWHDRRVEQLSRGMAQKLQFIAAVVHAAPWARPSLPAPATMHPARSALPWCPIPRNASYRRLPPIASPRRLTCSRTRVHPTKGCRTTPR